LNVTALEKGTGAKQSITISGSSNLNREEVERMMREAEMNADADRQAQELTELRNKAESLAGSTERTLKDAGDKVDEALRQRVTELVAELRQVIPNGAREEIQGAYDRLETESHAVAQKLYEAQNSGQPEEAGVGAAAGATGASNDDIVEGELVDEK
ncbi:molecular chaperone DnaK, partial [bacterium]